MRTQELAGKTPDLVAVPRPIELGLAAARRARPGRSPDGRTRPAPRADSGSAACCSARPPRHRRRSRYRPDARRSRPRARRSCSTRRRPRCDRDTRRGPAARDRTSSARWRAGSSNGRDTKPFRAAYRSATGFFLGRLVRRRAARCPDAAAPGRCSRAATRTIRESRRASRARTRSSPGRHQQRRAHVEDRRLRQGRDRAARETLRASGGDFSSKNESNRGAPVMMTRSSENSWSARASAR